MSSSVSVGSLGPGAQSFICASLVGMGFDSKCNFTPPTIFLGLLLCPWTGGISSQLLQCYSVTATERFSVSNIKVTGNK